MSEHVKVSKLKRMSAMIRDWLKALAIYDGRRFNLYFIIFPERFFTIPLRELHHRL